ncbi:MAG: TonB-dependent receptor plug domain-containing protein [Chitinophagaceae bacterium]
MPYRDVCPALLQSKVQASPGRDAANIYIRGNSTYASSMEPLFVVDGIVRTYRDFSQLDANEVESISVLKMLLPRRFSGSKVRMVYPRYYKKRKGRKDDQQLFF